MKKVALLTVLLVVAASAAITITFPGGTPSKVGEFFTFTISGGSQNDVVQLYVKSGPDNKRWISPTSTPLDASGSATVSNAEITHPGTGLKIYVAGAISGESAESFDVVAGDPNRWQILAPCEVPDPGLATSTTGKHGSAVVIAGGDSTYTINICDKWWNPATGGQTPSIETTDPFGHLPATPVVGANSIELRTAGSRYVKVYGGGLTLADSSKVTVNPGEATQLLLICPGEISLPGDDSATKSPGKYGDPEDATLGSKYLVEIRAVDDCWNKVPSYNDPDVNVYADTNLTADMTYTLEGGTTGPLVNVKFIKVNRQGEYIDAIGSLGLQTDYSTLVVVQPGVDRLEAEFIPTTVPVGVHADLEARAWIGDDPLPFGWADVELIEGSATHFHLDTTSIKIEDGVGSVDAWADTVGTYTVKVTAGDQADTVVLKVEERPGVTVIPNPFKYSAHGDIPIKFSYKVEETGAAEIMLLIADPYGNIVYKATYTSGEVVSPGTQEISWDGTNSKGNRIASGMYQAVVKITLKNLSTETLKKNFIVIW